MQEFNTLNIGTSNLIRVSCVRYLGILLDEQLHWKFHIHSLCK